MKNFKNYTPSKYSNTEYLKIEDGIYQTKDPYRNEVCYVTSLSFEHDPDKYEEENGSPQHITQVPFEGILDKFFVYVTDFYDELNGTSEFTCYQEFASSGLEDIRKLRDIIGKSFYAVPYIDEQDGEEYYNIVME